MAAIPLREVAIRTSRSSGPGGQHANVTASRVEAIFDVAASQSLTEEQKRRVIARAGPRVVAVAQDARSQARNRELALERLRGPPHRRARRPPHPASHAPHAGLASSAGARPSAGRPSESAPAGAPAPTNSLDHEMRWLIDGMNVIGTRPDGWWRDRDGAMLRLVKIVEQWAAHEGEDVTVVFERAPSPPIRSTVIEIAHAPKPKADAADDEIIRRLRGDPQPAAVRVVTSDRWLADRASAAGATVEGAESFRIRIEQRL